MATTSAQVSSSFEVWPEFSFTAWQDACATLHLWTQIVGKLCLAQTPWINHSWHVAFYVTARGLTTSPIPYGARVFEIDIRFHTPPAVYTCERRSAAEHGACAALGR